MKTFLLAVSRPLLLLVAVIVVGSGLTGCTTTDPSTDDTMVYPTPAEKNRQMQEKMSQVTRSLM